jgi:hypothetical protein
MMLIPAGQALDMLATLAPRAWCKRLLSWEVFSGPLNLYALKGEIIRFRYARDILDKAGFEKAPTEEELESLKANDDPEFYLPVIRAAAASSYGEPVETLREEWEGSSELPLPHWLSVFSDIDWEKGVLRIELSSGLVPSEWAFNDDQFTLDDHEKLEATLSDLAFELAAIELLAPSATAPEAGSSGSSAMAPKRIGRPPKWDWEAALAYVVQVANTPDGLPAGEGAQAQLEQIISSYFAERYGAEPAPSEVRRRASMIMAAKG